MNQEEYGRYLPRGGRKNKVEKASDSFSVIMPVQTAREQLLTEDDVDTVSAVTGSVVRVTVADKPDAETEEQRDDLMNRLRTEQGLVVHHEYFLADHPEETYLITDEIIVKFKSNVDQDRIDEILADSGVVVVQHYDILGQVYRVRVTDEAGGNPLKVSNHLESLDEVEYAEPSLVNRFAQQFVPADPLFADQWHLSSEHQNAPDIDANADISVLEAWQVTKGSRAVVVAVLDDGFDLTHPDFQGNGKVVEPVDFSGLDRQPLPEAGDYHGTPCAGVAIAEENGQGCVGVAPGCSFMPVRFPLSAPDPLLIDIFKYVSDRANVASCSWGMIPGNHGLHSAVDETLTELTINGGKDGKGLAIVFAAGNYDAPLNEHIDYTVRWLGQDALGQFRLFNATGPILNGFPAHPRTIAVSAINSLNRKSLYSNWGREISVGAPSNNFDPTTLGALQGRGITTTDNELLGDDFTPGSRYTHEFGGTSSATPLVAGVVALVKSANPALTASEIKEILENTADKIEDPTVDALYGHAKGTYSNGHSEWFGHGKVNAHRAVQEAVRRLAPLGAIELQNTDPQAIPDFPWPGIISPITVNQDSLVKGIEVTVNISHTWIGDLVVYLRSPQATAVLLHNRQGFDGQDIHQTYTVVDRPELNQMIDQSTAGVWSLVVLDRARRDRGVLNRWSLKLNISDGQGISPSTRAIAAEPVDDLTRIKGIGPKYAAKLASGGINAFGQLANSSANELQEMIQPSSYQKPDFAGWIKQAASLAANHG